LKKNREYGREELNGASLFSVFTAIKKLLHEAVFLTPLKKTC